ncbi:hypothetical protein [Xanthomonas theicola]|nr:hypothetical protein [Xanthomonas theicola]QNH25137.1 hypothetical protein G4Q83_10845 [Xanthomonas theicola]
MNFKPVRLVYAMGSRRPSPTDVSEMAIASADGVLALVRADANSLVHDALAPLAEWGWMLAVLLLVGTGAFLRLTWFAPDFPML